MQFLLIVFVFQYPAIQALMRRHWRRQSVSADARDSSASGGSLMADPVFGRVLNSADPLPHWALADDR
jgi:hypothetical protein